MSGRIHAAQHGSGVEVALAVDGERGEMEREIEREREMLRGSARASLRVKWNVVGLGFRV